MQTPTIAVCAATGLQGRSVVNHFLSTGHYKVRALVRNVTSSIALQHEQNGAELIKASYDDVESLKAAFKGVDFVFAYTSPPEDGSSEETLGKNIVDACLDQSEKQPLLILSTLPAASKNSNGRIKVPMYDDKAAVEEYARLKLPSSIFIRTTAFFENIITFHWLGKTDDGLIIRAPIIPSNMYQGMISIEHDLGICIERIIDKRDTLLSSKVVEITSTFMTWNQVCTVISKVTGSKVQFQPIDEEGLKNAMGPEMATQVANLLNYCKEYETFSELPANHVCPAPVFEGIPFESFEDFVKRVIVPHLKST